MTRILPASEWPFSVRMGTITFVRHGQKNGGGFSADLTERGRADAVAAGRLIESKVDLFIASPSPRTVSTAECIREGNGSSAPIVVEEQLAEPGLGLYTEFRPAMAAFFKCLVQIIDENRAETVVATTHNYVLDYVAAAFGYDGESELLSGITVKLDDIRSAAEFL